MRQNRAVPVIVGVGEVIDRKSVLSPRELLASASREAMTESGSIATLIDSIDIIAMHSFRYSEIAALLASDLGIGAVHMSEGLPGGETPIRLLGEVAERIANGECRAALLGGAEALRTRQVAAQKSVELDWGPSEANAKKLTALDFVTPFAARYGLVQPAHVYPLYENACRQAWKQSAMEAELESATLWYRYSEAAAGNPTAWIPRVHSVEAVRSGLDENRMIAYPYRKLMVANPMVNQGVAVIITNLADALDAGIPLERIVYIGSGAVASEPRDFLIRDRYDHSNAQDVVLNTTLTLNDVSAENIDLFELYSCFPIVPKMARRTLGLSDEVRPSVTGGLTFFGGPANNFMTHAIAAATRGLRAGCGRTSLLYGQGEFVTKHAAIVLSNAAPGTTPRMTNAQAAADALASKPPHLREEYAGPVVIESFTVVYDRNGAAVHAPIIARNDAGERVVCQVLGDDWRGIATLTDPATNPVGTRGVVVPGADGLLTFSTR